MSGLLAGLIASTAFASRAGAAPLHYTRGSDSSGWLPFEIYHGKHVYLRAVMNGRDVTALLDSGASVVVVNAPSAARLGVRAAGSTTGIGVGGTGASGVAHHVEISLGRLKFDPRQAVVVDETEIDKRSGHSQDIALGGEIFQDAIVDIDFAHRRLAFRKPEGFKVPAGAQVLTLHKAGDVRAVDAEIEGRTARMLFDLGNGGAAYLHPRFWDRPDFLAGRRQSTVLAGGWTGASAQKLVMLKRLSVGAVTFQNLPVILRGSGDGGSSEVDGNIGLPVWSRFHLIVDFPHDRLILAPPVDVTTPFSVNHTGLSLRTSAKGLEIIHVAAMSPAEAAHLAVGDVITSVQDVAAGKAVPLSSEWTSAPAQTRYRISLSDGRIVNLTTARYF